MYWINKNTWHALSWKGGLIIQARDRDYYSSIQGTIGNYSKAADTFLLDQKTIVTEKMKYFYKLLNFRMFNP